MALAHRMKRLERAVVSKRTLFAIYCVQGHLHQPIPPDFTGRVIKVIAGYRPCNCPPSRLAAPIH